MGRKKVDLPAQKIPGQDHELRRERKKKRERNSKHLQVVETAAVEGRGLLELEEALLFQAGLT